MAENKSLTKAWRAAHLRGINGDDSDEICIPEICDDIALWVRRNRRPSRRLSLRTFSVLLSGAARLYSRQLSRLMKDTFECSLFNSVTSRPVLSTAVSDIISTNVSESECTEYIPDDTESSSTGDLDEDMSDDESTVFTITPNNNQQSTSNEQGKRDTQTCPIQEAVEVNGFDSNLPFGYVIVHDTYHSRIPSKILFSSLSENVKFLQNRSLILDS